MDFFNVYGNIKVKFTANIKFKKESERKIYKFEKNHDEFQL